MLPEPADGFLPPGPGGFIPSEYARANMALFGATHTYRPVRGAFPGLTGTTYDGVGHLLPLFDLADVPAEQLDAALAGQNCFYPVARPVLERLDAGLFEITCNPDDSDYVYPAKAFRDYDAPALRYKARLRADFMAQAAPESLDAASDAGALREILRGWLSDVGKAAEETDYGQALEAIEHRAALGLFGRLAVTRAREPVGFVLASTLAPDCRVVHFAKGRRAFRGVYPYLFSELARHDADGVWFNFEQDLGKARFRQNKRSFAPAHMVEKFRLRPKNLG